MTDPLSSLRAELAEDERIARAADHTRWLPEDKGVTFEYDDTESDYSGRVTADTKANMNHIARFGPKRTLRQVAAIREKVIAPYLAAVDAVEATVSARQYAASRYTLAAIRLDHYGGGGEMEERQAQERRTREELLSAEVQFASDVATRDALASVISALAAVYPNEEGS